MEKCKQPKNEERIKQNKKKYFDQKRSSQGNENSKNGQGNSNGGGGGSKGSVDKSSPQYQRKKWENAGLVMVGNMLKCKCPVCGPNFTHAGGKHDAWKAGTYTIPPHHPLFT